MPYIDGIKPNVRKMFRRVGMAVSFGAETHQQMLELADKLDACVVLAHELRMYVQGDPFDNTLRAVAEQLRETVEDDINREIASQGITCNLCGEAVTEDRMREHLVSHGSAAGSALEAGDLEQFFVRRRTI